MPGFRVHVFLTLANLLALVAMLVATQIVRAWRVGYWDIRVVRWHSGFVT